jgi:hypothetical protein
MQSTLLPNADFVGNIYGPPSGTPMKLQHIECFVVTRVSKTEVFAKKLQMVEIMKPVGNGFLNTNNLGTLVIEKPFVTIGKEKPFFAHSIYNMEFIRRGDRTLFLMDENAFIPTLSSESSVGCKTPWN